MCPAIVANEKYNPEIFMLNISGVTIQCTLKLIWLYGAGLWSDASQAKFEIIVRF